MNLKLKVFPAHPPAFLHHWLRAELPDWFSTGLTRLLKEEEAQDIVEYSLLLTLIGALSVTVLTMVGINVSKLFSRSLLLTQQADTALDLQKQN